MGKIIMITSGKGGVGKTTLSATLGHALSKRGASVLLVDGDMGLRDLDLALGVQDEVLFTSRDLWKKECFAEDAIIPIDEKLFFLSASQKHRWEDLKKKPFSKLISKLSSSYDYVLVDAPAGIGRGMEAICSIAHEAIIVVEPSWMSIRDGQKVIELFRKERFFNYVAVINKLDRSSSSNSMSSLTIGEILDCLGVEGIVTALPYEKDIFHKSNDGLLGDIAEDSFYAKMLNKLVDRVMGDDEIGPEVREIEEEYMAYVKETTVLNERNVPFDKQLDRRRSNSWKWSYRRR